MEKSLYEQMDNPLQRSNFIPVLVSAYETRGTLYNALTYTQLEEKESGTYHIQDKDDFYMKMYEIWRSSLITLDEKNWVKPEYKEELHLLVYYLRKWNPKNAKEVLSILDPDQYKREDLKKAIEDFRWNKIGEMSGWEHIHSNFVKYGLSKNQTIKHRLYINCDSNRLHLIMRRFIEKCTENQSSYYFKFDEFGSRSDTLVIYSDDKHLPFYVKILREIKQEEHLDTELHHPPLATGWIDSWIGYGSDPEGEDESFNGKREKHLQECMDTCFNEWMRENLGLRFKVNGQETNYQTFLKNRIVEEMIETTIRYIPDNDRNRDHRGYGKEDVTTPEMKKRIDDFVKKHFREILYYYQTGELKIDESIPCQKGKIDIRIFTLDVVRKKQIAFLTKHTQAFEPRLLNKIKSTSRSHGISIDNYAVDSYIEETLKGSSFARPQNNPRKGVVWVGPMTDEEIKESRKKLGFE